MGEDDLVELLWKSGQVVRSSHSQRPSSDKSSPPPPILRGSGSGGGEENAPLSLPPAPMHQQNLFIQEDEIAYWLHRSYRHQYYCSELLCPIPASSVSLAPSPSSPYILPAERPASQMLGVRRTENLMNFSWLRGYISTGSRVEVPVVRESTQVGSNATPSSSATESCVIIPATEATESRVSRTFSVPGLGRKGKAVAIETARTSSSGVCKAETDPTQLQPATDKKETITVIEATEEGRGSTSRKRSRAAEMHNLYERRRRAQMNEMMKALQELTPRCSKSAKASMLSDVIEYVKYLQSQIQMISMVQQMMYAGNMQQFMSHHMLGMNLSPVIPFLGTPFSSLPHMGPLGPPFPAPLYPSANIQTSDPSRVHLPTRQPNPGSNQPQLPAYMNPYGYFVGLLHQMQQPPPLQSQTTTHLSFSHASISRDLQDPDKKPHGD